MSFSCTIGKLVPSLLLFFALTPTLGWSDHAPPRSSVDVPAKLRELKVDGDKIIKAIIAKDVVTILRFFHEGGVAVDFDHNLSLREVEEQLRSGKGLLHAMFFDTARLRRVSSNKDSLSLYDHLVKAKEVTVEIEDLDQNSLPGEPLWARMVLKWEGRPTQGIYDPVFIYFENGWKFSTFFTHP